MVIKPAELNTLYHKDDVLIGPKVNLITINHPLVPYERQSTIST